MRWLNRKSNIFLAVLIYIFCIAFMVSGETTDEHGKKLIFSDSVSSSHNGENEEISGPNLTDSLQKMTWGVLIVVILGVAVMYASKKILPEISHVQGKHIKIVETLHLGSRKTIHLLEVSGQQILIGSTPDKISKLTDIFSENRFPLNKPAVVNKDEASE